MATEESAESTTVVLVNAHDDPERFPHLIARGIDANVGALRGTDAQTTAAFFQERNTNSVALDANAPAILMEAPIACTVQTMQALPDNAVYGDQDQDDDDAADTNNESDEPDEPVQPQPVEEPVTGEVFVTSTQVLFVAADQDQSDSDLAIGGSCVILHAMTDDPEPSVYLQLSGGEADGIAEATFVPSDNQGCQKLFDALCKLVSLHPVDDEDDDDEGMFRGGGFIGGGFGDDAMADYGEGSDGLVWAPPTNAAARAATEDERGAMLEHLDNLLEVVPDLEVQETQQDHGQFDDAPEN